MPDWSERDRAIREEFPEFFSGSAGSRDVVGAYGLGGIGDGWVPLVREALQRLREVSAEEGSKVPRISQIKEKWGTLNVYTLGTTDAQQAVLDEIEERSMVTCEKCGAPGTHRSGGWWRTLCDEHEAELKAGR